MNKLITIFVLLVGAYIGWGQFNQSDDSAAFTNQNDTVLSDAFNERLSVFRRRVTELSSKSYLMITRAVATSALFWNFSPVRPCLLPTTLILHRGFLTLEKAIPSRSMGNMSGTQKVVLSIGHIMTPMDIMRLAGSNTMVKFTNNHLTKRSSGLGDTGVVRVDSLHACLAISRRSIQNRYDLS